MGEIFIFFKKKKKKRKHSRKERTTVRIYFSEDLRVPKLFSCFDSFHPACAKMRRCSGCCYTMHTIPKHPSRLKTKRKHEEKKVKQESLVFTILSIQQCVTSPNLPVAFKMPDLLKMSDSLWWNHVLNYVNRSGELEHYMKKS